jgi:hypothetical protein
LPEQPTVRQGIAEERAQLLDQLLHDIAALQELVDQSQQLTDDVRAAPLRSREVGAAIAPLPPADQDTSA